MRRRQRRPGPAAYREEYAAIPRLPERMAHASPVAFRLVRSFGGGCVFLRWRDVRLLRRLLRDDMPVLFSLCTERRTGPCKKSVANKFDGGYSELHVKAVRAHSIYDHEVYFIC